MQGSEMVTNVLPVNLGDEVRAIYPWDSLKTDKDAIEKDIKQKCSILTN